MRIDAAVCMYRHRSCVQSSTHTHDRRHHKRKQKTLQHICYAFQRSTMYECEYSIASFMLTRLPSFDGGLLLEGKKKKYSPKPFDGAMLAHNTACNHRKWKAFIIYLENDVRLHFGISFFGDWVSLWWLSHTDSHTHTRIHVHLHASNRIVGNEMERVRDFQMTHWLMSHHIGTTYERNNAMTLFSGKQGESPSAFYSKPFKIRRDELTLTHSIACASYYSLCQCPRISACGSFFLLLRLFFFFDFNCIEELRKLNACVCVCVWC